MAVTIEKKQTNIVVTKDGQQFIVPAGIARFVQKRTVPDYVVLTTETESRGAIVEFKYSDVEGNPYGNVGEMLDILAKSNTENLDQKPVIARFLVKEGDTRKNANENYAGGAVKFELKASDFGQNAKLVLMDVLAYLQDSGSLDTESYGNGITLTNGVKIFVEKDGSAIDLLDGEPILWNSHYGKHGWGTTIQSYGSGDESLQAVIKFKELFGYGLELDAATDDRIYVELNDDLTGLVEHFFKVAAFIK